MATVALIAAGLPIGFLIGVVGIGGVLLAPALALASFVLGGAVAAAAAHRNEAALRLADWCLLAALVPGALVGSLVTPLIPTAALSLVISVCIVLAGVSCLGGAKAEPTA